MTKPTNNFPIEFYQRRIVSTLTIKDNIFRNKYSGIRWIQLSKKVAEKTFIIV